MPPEVADRAAEDRPLRVLALTAHSVVSPAPRYRVFQFVEPLRRLGIQVEVQSFTRSEDYDLLFDPGHRLRKARWLVEGTVRRAAALSRVRNYDAVLVQVWLHPMRFPPLEAALESSGVPFVYDIDDAYYLPTGRKLDLLRGPDWLPRLMRHAHTITAGSEFIAEYCAKHNPHVELLPTAIDTDRFAPRPPDVRAKPVVGWVGTHSTLGFLERLYPVFQELAKDHTFVLRIVSDRDGISVPGVEVDSVKWRLEHEVDYFRDLDVGLYPLSESGPAQWKQGFKLHQYMAVGVPCVASDIGANAKLVRHGETAFLAKTPEDWKRHLSALIRDPELRRRVGGKARKELDASLSLRATAEKLARILREAARAR